MSQAMFTTYSACSLTGIKNGYGKHVDDVHNISRTLYFWWLCEIFYNLSTLFLRLSIAVFMTKLCSKKIHFYILYTTMTLIVGYSIFYFFIVIFQCHPVSYFWNQAMEGANGSCLNEAVIPRATFGHSVLSAMADVVLSVLPGYLVKDLKMNMRTKLSVAVILGLGIM
jgi:hypothetical protein